MKGRIFGVMAAATLGLTSLASAAGLELSSISPPGAGLPGSDARLFAGPQGSMFSGSAATSGNAENLSAADLGALVAAVSPVVGQVYVFSVDNSIGETSLVILAGGSFNSTLMNAGTGEGVFQTGGVTVSQVVGGGYTSSGTLNTSTHAGLTDWAAFVYDDMALWSTGSITLYGGGSGTIATNATVNFLSWNAGTSSYDVETSTAMDGSLAFNFQVVPVPAPALLAGVGLLGAGIVRRRMARN